jgi:hypothetical protein
MHVSRLCAQYYARSGEWERACDLFAQSDRPIAHVLAAALGEEAAAKPLVTYFDAVLFDADLGESLLVDEVADQVTPPLVTAHGACCAGQCTHAPCACVVPCRVSCLCGVRSGRCDIGALRHARSTPSVDGHTGVVPPVLHPPVCPHFPQQGHDPAPFDPARRPSPGPRPIHHAASCRRGTPFFIYF